MKFVKGGKYEMIHNIDTSTKHETSWVNETDIISAKRVDNNFCTMLHLFDDLWLDKIIPKNNDCRQSHIRKSRE